MLVTLQPSHLYHPFRLRTLPLISYLYGIKTVLRITVQGDDSCFLTPLLLPKLPSTFLFPL